MNSNFANNLKKIRKENNLSQEQLADQLGVSRQSVSKWEQSQSYPEMDKVFQICKIFNLNIDELLNQDIKEVKANKESKNKIDKYINDFLSYITKTINMFSCMNYKNKIKCILEQVIVVFILVLLSLIFYEVGNFILSSILKFLPIKIYNVINGFFELIYLIICLIFSFIILIHIFKIRYLDYYEIVRKEKDIDESVGEEEKNKLFSEDKILLNKNKEKIIIRDPKHSEYKFINGLFKCLLFIIKCITLFIFLGFSILLIGLIFGLVISIYHILVNSLFIGISLIIISCIIIDIIVLIGLFCFMFDKTFKTRKNFIIFISSLIIGGIGLGLSFVSILKLDYYESNYDNVDETSKYFEYNDKTKIYSSNGNYEFKVDNNLTDKILVKVSYNKKIYNINFEYNDNIINFHYSNKYDSFSKFYQLVKKDLKNNRISSYEFNEPQYIIITSENNIKEIINKKSNKTLTNLTVEDDKYHLMMDDNYYPNSTLCYLENGYYNNCILFTTNYDEVDISEFIYDEDGLEYDNEKYICDKEGTKEYHCYPKS